MVTTVTIPRTAHDLLARVEPFGPIAEGSELAFAAEPPAELIPALRMLHTGVRAALAGRRWWGASAVGGKPRVVELRTDAPVPANVGLLCVEGDPRWDRLAPDARLDLPHLFAQESSGPSGRSRK